MPSRKPRKPERDDLSVRETARRLGVHENTVRNWADRGILVPARRLPVSGYRRFAPAAVEQLKRRMRKQSGRVSA